MSGNYVKNRIKIMFLIFALISLGFFGIFVFEGVFHIGGVEAVSIIVDSNGQGDYTRIQDAIDNASIGDSIYIRNGIYQENLVINKSLSLKGNGSSNTKIIGIDGKAIIHISANWVNVSGLNITTHMTSEYPFYIAGIYLDNVENVTIENNNCSKNGRGIYQDQNMGYLH